MDNMKPQFNPMGSDDGNSWRTPTFRQNMVAKIEEVVQRSGVSIARNPTEMENHVFTKAKSREEYVGMIAKLILHFRERDQQKPNQGGGNMQGPNQQQNPNMQVQNQPGQPPQGPPNQGGLPPDPINALQNLASQGSRNQMMNMGPQGQMPQQGVMGPNPGMGPNQMGMQGQMGQQPMTSQAPQPTASNLLQTLNQRPQLNMQMQKLGGGMGMVPNQGQMGGNMMGGMNPMGSQLQNQLNAPMQGMTMGSMGMGNMQGPMGGGNTMGGQMQCNQVGMGGQIAPGGMQGQMGGQMVGGMGGNQMVNMPMMHMSRMQKPEMLSAGYGGPRGPQPGQYLRQSPSPSAPSPGMPGPSPASMNMMGGPMPSPMSQGLSGLCGAGVGSPSSQQHMSHPQQRGVGMGMVASPSSSLNTPGGASPGGEEAAYREKVRQLSKYIEPLRRMVHRMVSEGENIEKLTKMKNLLDILSNPNKRVPLETLIKCEVVLEKLDFKRSEGVSLIPQGKEQIFNPLLEVVNNCLQSPNANHTLKRTFGSALDALNGPEIKSLPPPQKMPKVEEESTIDIPDVLQGEIARLDSRFKVSLETNQLSGSNGEISLIATLDDSRLPCVPPVRVSVPRDYPAQATKLHVRSTKPAGDTFLARVETSLMARTARLPKNCSLGQLLDAWEMSVRQACAPTPSTYTPVPALGL